jgi:hypothetical protein
MCSGWGCTSEKQQIARGYKSLSIADRQLADSVLLYGLDHEALYSLASSLKPMSSVKFYRMPVASNNKVQRDSAKIALQQLYRITDALTTKKHIFVLSPFERNDSIYKNVEIYVFNRIGLDALLERQSNFFNKWGFVEGARAETILAVTEYEQKYDRWRSYGYLFGYPNHAVDFFVQAGKEQDSTGKFVKRDFFNMPVWVGKQGYFTYAIPKGYIPTDEDSAIYTNAVAVLNKYTVLRKKVANKQNGIPAVKLWRKLL